MSTETQHERECTGIPVGMRPGIRQLNDASLCVTPAGDALPEHMRAGVREITSLHVPLESRRKRIATALLNFVCQEADANCITLMLTAHPMDDEGLSEAQLVAWYQRFGFQPLEETVKGTVMARRVHVKEESRIERVDNLDVRNAVREILHRELN